MQFYFKKAVNDSDLDALIFCKIDQIFEYNYDLDKVETIYEFEKDFVEQPEFFITNSDQTVFMMTSPIDALYYNKTTSKEIDIDELFDVTKCKSAYYDQHDKQFFLLSNQSGEKLGFFLTRFSEENPENFKFLIKWNNKLEIGDPNIYMFRSGPFKELIVSYKQIYVNTHNVVVMDADDDDEQTLIFRHESFQLWESEIQGLLLQQQKDFVILSKDGMNIVALGRTDKRTLQDNQGNDRMIHSLESYNFLKVDPSNFILYEMADENNRRISI